MADNISDSVSPGISAQPNPSSSDDNAINEPSLDESEELPFDDAALECPHTLKARGENLEEVCKLISHHKWNIGTFQADLRLFAHTKRNDPRNSPVRKAIL